MDYESSRSLEIFTVNGTDYVKEKNNKKASNDNEKSTQCDITEAENSALRLLYNIEDTPPWQMTIFLGLQQYLSMFSDTLSVPYILAPALCIKDGSPAKAYLISTIMFVSGITTFIQSTFGIRLPMIQGGSFSYLLPTLSILNSAEFKCTAHVNVTMGNNTSVFEDDDAWMVRMREIQGAIIVSSIAQFILGLSGVMAIAVRIITPLTIATCISLIGLSFFGEVTVIASGNWGISLGATALFILFSQYLERIRIPLPSYNLKKGCTTFHMPLFQAFPILLTLFIMWGISAILTYTNVIAEGSTARSDYNLKILKESPWIRVPYPFQWGIPTVSFAAVIGMLTGVIGTGIESIGNYYASVRITGTPAPPDHALNRGIMFEGIGCFLAGLFGTGNGTTTYIDNIAICNITKVASRKIMQTAGLFMIILAVITKFGAVFVSIPAPIVGGLFFCTFGLIVSLGLGTIQYVNLNNSRNIFVLGASLFIGLSIPRWISEHSTAIDTGSSVLNEFLLVILSSSILVGSILCCFLDNTIPGSDEERGMHKWKNFIRCDEDVACPTYDLPFCTPCMRKVKLFSYIPICPPYTRNNCLFNVLRRCFKWPKKTIYNI